MFLRRTLKFSTLATAALLAACGGGGSADGTSVAEAAAPDMRPLYELSPVLPGEPSDIDADGSNTSATQAPGGRSTVQAAPGNGEAGALATAAAVYYTPAQVRAAYGLDKLPAVTTANKGAPQGSGQTIAIVGAYHNGTLATDLATFNQKFGLPSCSTLNVAATTTLPLAKAAAGSGCSFAVVYATAAGTMSTRAPVGNSSWATEMALDVQWAHAMAPLARIIVVEAAGASAADIMGAVALASKLGASVVSMSFGAAEFSGQAGYDALFKASGVTYLAATGDNGRGVAWPAVSAQVLAVGGTTLAWNGSTRSETGWSGSGGGLSAYNAVPAWQTGVKVTDTSGKLAAPTRRALPDVAFNANPSSGQLVFATSAGGWVVAGGTSIGTPQWAGLVAVANATRALAGKAALGPIGSPLFKTLAGSAASYGANLLDVTAGSNGNCKGCAATAGYDLVTGLGTPNAVKVVEQLAAL